MKEKRERNMTTSYFFTLSKFIQYDILSYLSKYEYIDFFSLHPNIPFVEYVPFYEPLTSDHSLILQLKLKKILHIIDQERMDLLIYIYERCEFYSYMNLIFTLILLFGSEEMVYQMIYYPRNYKYTWTQMKEYNMRTREYYEIGFEIFAFKLRNKIYIKNFWEHFQIIQKTFEFNPMLVKIFQNYYTKNHGFAQLDFKIYYHLEKHYYKNIMTRNKHNIYNIIFDYQEKTKLESKPLNHESEIEEEE